MGIFFWDWTGDTYVDRMYEWVPEEKKDGSNNLKYDDH